MTYTGADQQEKKQLVKSTIEAGKKENLKTKTSNRNNLIFTTHFQLYIQIIHYADISSFRGDSSSK